MSRVALPIFINLRPSPLIEREIKVLMAQGAIQRGVVSAAMEVVNCGRVQGDSAKRSNAHVEGIHVCHIILILRALIPNDPLVPAWKPAWRKRDTRQARMWLWHRVQLAL